GAEEAGDDGGGDFCGHATAPLARGTERAASRSPAQPKTLPSTSQNMAEVPMVAAANSVARCAGTALGSSGTMGAPMKWGMATSATARAMAQAARVLTRSRMAAPVAMAVPTHQSWRANRSAAGMPGNSGASP